METASAINATTNMAITRIVDMPHRYPLQPKVTMGSGLRLTLLYSCRKGAAAAGVLHAGSRQHLWHRMPSASPTPYTLGFRYYVKLDPAEIPKAMFAETSPDGSLIWTSSGDDLLAYRSSDVSASQPWAVRPAAPCGAPPSRCRAAHEG